MWFFQHLSFLFSGKFVFNFLKDYLIRKLDPRAKYLSMKEGSLFCFVLFCSYEIHCTRMLQIVLLVSLESSRWGGVHGLGSTAFGLAMQKVHEHWMISSLKIKWSRTRNFRRNWNVPLVLLERSCLAGFNGIYLVRFGFRMWEILIFKWFLLLKIQINSKKPGFGRKNQLRTW